MRSDTVDFFEVQKTWSSLVRITVKIVAGSMQYRINMVVLLPPYSPT